MVQKSFRNAAVSAALAASLTVGFAPNVHAAASSELVAASVAPGPTPWAQAKSGRTKCVKGSSTYGGHCWTVKYSSYKTKTVEATPLVNHSRKSVDVSCSFSKTISKSFEAGYAYTAEAKANVMGLVDAGTSHTLHMNYRQTGEQASRVGAGARLKPGQRIICLRTYGWVRSSVREFEWRNLKTTFSKSTTVDIPSGIGITVVD